ncbi:basic-Leucine zipper transcription factor [Penicillium canariense]|uniref:Basic-Leucine zipper transcription factor n=1 Tax=Penicillium canariense TaxID=189055 RepID=A0A9W9LK82_9EURO|nr:basic-Leucine zipper transcription factor [Penicillium canariense]KAJ5160051.1 basic-Leucine zipper transcription factor [Penicillium canariense]
MSSQEIIIRDLFELHAQFSNKLNDLQQDGPEFVQQHDARNGMTRALSEMVQDAASGYQPLIIPKFNEPIDFGSWRSNHEGMLYESITDSEAQKTTPANSHITDSGAFNPSLPGHRDSMDERLDSLLERVEDAGFENFDSLVTAYYSSTFPESSPLYIEQSLSRERRLSRVLWEIFRSSTQWAVREREGFNEEITKISESILITESCNAHSALVCKLGPLMVDSHSGPTDITPQRVIDMKRIVTNEHPKFWAFIVGLASANPTLRPKDRSNIALAVMLLLNLAGHIPREQLIRVIISCL